jgi:GNAT superfamily N-acetyltransferase
MRPIEDIRRAVSDAEILACFSVFKELRPHLKEAEIVGRVRRQEQDQGYELVFVEAGGRPVALAGFRQAEFLAWGRVFYVDDLVTAEASRGAGYGSRLMDWLIAEARRRGCDELHLDSGVHRFSAHRLYHARRLEITSHHFSLRLR